MHGQLVAVPRPQEAAPLVADLLAAAPALTVLATSREPLRLRAERLFRLDPLALPPDLSDGLDALDTASRDAPARQRTLTATLEWSCALLARPEQMALAALAVFAGGCTIDAAQTVTGEPLDVFEALVDKNLLVVREVEDGSGRLVMLETVREFARGRLAQRSEAGDTHRRHCEYYLALAERAAPELRRSDALVVVAALEREINNFRAALTWSLEQPAPVPALRLATAFQPYLGRQGLSREASRWLGAALGVSGNRVPASVHAAALEAYANSLTLWNTKEAEAAARKSLQLRRSLGVDDPPGPSSVVAYQVDKRTGCLSGNELDRVAQLPSAVAAVAAEHLSQQARGVDANWNGVAAVSVRPCADSTQQDAYSADSALGAAGDYGNKPPCCTRGSRHLTFDPLHAKA